jgi:O-antigen/teichoic acid export membrane protein
VFGWNLITAAFGLLSTLALARSLSLEEFGKISLILSVAAIVQGVVSFGFNNAVVIYLNQNGVQLRSTLLAKANVIFFSYLPVALLVAIPAIYFTSGAYNFSLFELVTIWVLSAIFSFTAYLISIFQAFQQWNQYSILNALNAVVKFLCLSVALVGAYFLALDRYSAVIAALVLFVIAYLIIVTLYSRQHFIFSKVSSEVLRNRDYWKLVITIGFTNLIIVIAMRIDIFIVEHFVGIEALGVYAAAISLASAFPLLANALMNVYVVRAAQEKGRPVFLQTLVRQQIKYFLPVIALGSVVALVSPYLVPFIFGLKFVPSVAIFNILLIAFLGGVVFTPIESHLYANRQPLIMGIKLIQLAAVIVFSIWLVDIYGVNGVALSIVSSRLIGWVIISIVVRQEMLSNV